MVTWGSRERQALAPLFSKDAENGLLAVGRCQDREKRVGWAELVLSGRGVLDGIRQPATANMDETAMLVANVFDSARGCGSKFVAERKMLQYWIQENSGPLCPLLQLFALMAIHGGNSWQNSLGLLGPLGKSAPRMPSSHHWLMVAASARPSYLLHSAVEATASAAPRPPNKP